MSTKRIRSIIGVVVVMCAAVLTGCGAGSSGDTKADNTEQAETELVQNEESLQEQTVVDEDMVIETKYGTLHYNDQWREYVRVSQTEDGDVVSISFTALINGKEYPLFDVSIGGGPGSEVGKLTDSEGKMRIVYIKASEIKEEKDLNANEQNRLYAMQEDINYIVDHLK